LKKNYKNPLQIRLQKQLDLKWMLIALKE